MAELEYLNLYTTDPAFNLAAEQYVFDKLPKDRMYFMLWQNDNAIIIGKFQNTAAEINAPYVEEHGIKVVRRLSGGGAVYHDLGNLNFTFIADAGDIEKLNMRVFCEPVAKALNSLGVNAEINGRNDITIEGKKFSGNSQYIKDGRVMHHGTIMFDSNLSMVGEALKADTEKIAAKGIKSVRSRVTNIKPYIAESIELEEFRKRILNFIISGNNAGEHVFDENEIKEINRIKQERYDTWDWNYGKSPECSIIRSKRIEGCGRIETYISTEHGLVTGISFRGDFFSAKDPSALAERFIGRRADRSGFSEALKDVDLNSYFSGVQFESMISLLCGE